MARRVVITGIGPSRPRSHRTGHLAAPRRRRVRRGDDHALDPAAMGAASRPRSRVQPASVVPEHEVRKIDPSRSSACRRPGAMHDAGLAAGGSTRTAWAACSASASAADRHRATKTGIAHGARPAPRDPFFIPKIMMNAVAASSRSLGTARPELRDGVRLWPRRTSARLAFRAIKHGDAEMLAGGTEATIRRGSPGFCALRRDGPRATTRRRSEPSFRQGRDGFVMARARVRSSSRSTSTRRSAARDLRGVQGLRHDGRRLPLTSPARGRGRGGAMRLA